MDKLGNLLRLVTLVLVIISGGNLWARDVSSKEAQAFLDNYSKIFNAGDATELGELWKPEGEFIDVLGHRIVGRDAIVKQFATFFTKNNGAKLKLKLLSVKQPEPTVLVLEISPELSPAPTTDSGEQVITLVLNKVDKKWLIEGVRERITAPPSFAHLKALDWMVGVWTSVNPNPKEEKEATEKSSGAAQGDESTKPADSVKEEGGLTEGTAKKADVAVAGISYSMSVEWTANKSFLINYFSMKRNDTVIHGQEVIAWDPKEKKLKSWAFDSTGGFTQSLWRQDGSKWVIESKGVLADGQTTSTTHAIAPEGTDSLACETTKVIQYGKKPETINFKLYRQTAGKPEAK